MWLLLALISTLCIGISTILSKIGIKDTDAYITGAVTNTVLLSAFAGTAVFSGVFSETADMGWQSWLSVCASGIVLSISWAFYFLGLKGGSISVFLAIQSLTIVFSMVLCRIFIKEAITFWMLVGTGLIIAGTLLMMNRKELHSLTNFNLLQSDQKWILFSALSAACASVSYVIVKADTTPVDTNVTSTYRYIIVVAFLWVLLYVKRKPMEKIKNTMMDIPKKTWLFILFGAAFSGAGHVLVYKALFLGKAAVIMTIYRMGMVVSIVLSRFFLHENLSKKGWIGLGLLILGVALFALPK